jgi:gag-polypeptide of LTR copia-type
VNTAVAASIYSFSFISRHLRLVFISLQPLPFAVVNVVVMSSIEKDPKVGSVIPLEGSANYRTWKYSMKMVLMVKDLWEVVDGTEVKPSDEKEGLAWTKKSQKALAHISLSLAPIEQHHILDCTTAKAAWDILEKLYEGKGRNRKFLLMEQLFKFNMENHETTMDVYLRTMKDKISELSSIGITLDKEVKLALIFNGIPEYFRYLVVSLEQQDLDFDELSARLIEEAERCPTSPYNDIAGGPSVGYLARIRKGGNHVQMKCFYCGQLGHVKATCEVRKYRMDKYGDGKDEENMSGDARKGKALSARVAF